MTRVLSPGGFLNMPLNVYVFLIYTFCVFEYIRFNTWGFTLQEIHAENLTFFYLLSAVHCICDKGVYINCRLLNYDILFSHQSYVNTSLRLHYLQPYSHFLFCLSVCLSGGSPKLFWYLLKVLHQCLLPDVCHVGHRCTITHQPYAYIFSFLWRRAVVGSGQSGCTWECSWEPKSPLWTVVLRVGCLEFVTLPL